MEQSLKQETFLPEPDGQDRMGQVISFLEAQERAGRGTPRTTCLLSGAEPHDQVELPPELYRVLRQAAEALQRGLAVTIAPVGQKLTTQQAAELLGISRPTLVRLLEDGEIPFERVGSHRRISLRELLDYQSKRRAAQYAFLAATTVDEDEDIETALKRVREARREVGTRRRGRSS
ncbi:helix-turn-helix domain-containing protein [Actinokineospora diospyrosa]|uniref:DNA binding domain-containing protein, excisionase family n=1 Tax=Actinokineospora diospyrosa TaxID=103728 RepID=A0ABT1I7H7_9PSEU|nr:helix-turn-helix domain-containing protein [Actinokineospora diospyrosa]MCP2268590.1 DNA binding domain-containing protein, excisionase family [Actinokineospora diospyrosa]